MERGFPERFVKRKELNFLLREVALWRDSGIIDPAQASAIEGLYAPRKGHFPQVLLGLGGMLVGLGFLSAVAANWLDMPRAFRAVLIVLCYLFSILAAWRAEAEFPRTSRAFLLLGSFIYGGGIFLIAQMFHQGGHWTTAVAWWFAGVLPVALLFRDPFQVLLMQALAIVFLYGFHAPWFGLFGSYWSAPQFSVADFLRSLFRPQRVLILLALWAAWWRLGERRRLCFGMNVFATLSFIGLPLFAYLSDPAQNLIVLGGIGMLMVLCSFGERKGDLEGWGIMLTGVCGLFLTISMVWRDSVLPDCLPRFNALVVGMGFSSPDTAFAVLSALILSLLMLWLTWRGHTLATTFFCLLVLRYYFDGFYDFMPKAAFFTVGGLLLIALGYFMERVRRRAKRIRTTLEEGKKA